MSAAFTGASSPRLTLLRRPSIEDESDFHLQFRGAGLPMTPRFGAFVGYSAAALDRSTALAAHLLPPQLYEVVRAPVQQQIIEKKRRRRIRLGDCVTVLFEDLDTVVYQAHEIRRAEHLDNSGRLVDELRTLGGLVPNVDELSVSVFVDGSCEGTCQHVADVLAESPSALRLVAGGVTHAARAADEDSFPAGAVRYFHFSRPRSAGAWALSLQCDCYQTEATLPEPLTCELRQGC